MGQPCPPPTTTFPLPAKPGSRCLPSLKPSLGGLLRGTGPESIFSPQGPALGRVSRQVTVACVSVDHSRGHRADGHSPSLGSHGSQLCSWECLWEITSHTAFCFCFSQKTWRTIWKQTQVNSWGVGIPSVLRPVSPEPLHLRNLEPDHWVLCSRLCWL